MHGKLYYVPGGDEVGSFYMTEKPDGHGGRFSLETYNPDGWQVVGKDREIRKIIGDVKRICETDLGLITRCCLIKYVYKVNKQYLANVFLKINVKMGGRNTILLDAHNCKIPLVGNTPTIIFGADVTHPENGGFQSIHSSCCCISRLTRSHKVCRLSMCSGTLGRADLRFI